MKYHVRHSTLLAYSAAVEAARFNLRLVPLPWPGETFGRHDLGIDPVPSIREDSVGPYCVNTTRIGFDFPLRQVEIVSAFDVDVVRVKPTGPGPAVAEVRAAGMAERDISARSAAPYLFASRIAVLDPQIGKWAAGSLGSATRIVPAVSALMSTIHGDFTYRPGVTTSRTPPLDAFRLREGVCQDFAHIMIMGLRSHGIPAAYASGYLRTVPPPGKARLIGSDAMHAWVNAWCGPELGWVGFDPTNDCLVGEDHIQIAMGRDYADVAPIDGIFIGTNLQKVTTAVDVEERP